MDMKNPDKLATLGVQDTDEGKQKKTQHRKLKRRATRTSQKHNRVIHDTREGQTMSVS